MQDVHVGKGLGLLLGIRQRAPALHELGPIDRVPDWHQRLDPNRVGRALARIAVAIQLEPDIQDGRHMVEPKRLQQLGNSRARDARDRRARVARDVGSEPASHFRKFTLVHAA